MNDEQRARFEAAQKTAEDALAIYNLLRQQHDDLVAKMQAQFTVLQQANDAVAKVVADIEAENKNAAAS